LLIFDNRAFSEKCEAVSDKNCGKNKELEHFQQKWTPVLRRKMRKNKGIERLTDA